MSIKSKGASVLTVNIAAGLLLAAGLATTAADQRPQLAMHDMMQMQSQGQMPMQPQGQKPMQSQGGDMTDEHTRMLNDQMRMRGAMPGMSMGPGTVDLTDRLEGRLAFIRAEIRITDAQAATWNTFADALRSSRRHLIEARQQLNQAYSKSTDRLEQYERHLGARLEAVKSARAAFTQLYASLDGAQKHTADELVTPFITTF